MACRVIAAQGWGIGCSMQLSVSRIVHSHGLERFAGLIGEVQRSCR
jgi:hypothetical protein